MNLDVAGDTVCALVTAAAMAQTGHGVRLLLPAGAVADQVVAGKIPFHEPFLHEAFASERAAGRLELCPLDQCDDFAAIIFCALQPGMLPQAEQIAATLAGQHETPLLINQSVFPVGTAESLAGRLKAGGGQGAVVAFPDTLQDGLSWTGFVRPKHIMLGCEDRWAGEEMRELLRPFNRRSDVIQLMTLREAEFAKLAVSGMLATRVSFMNDMALLAEQLGVDIERVRLAMASDERVGDAYLYSGCGFGGAGFSRDVMNLSEALHNRNTGTRLLDEVLAINERQKEVLFRKFWRRFHCDVVGRSVVLWGGAFKPGTNRIHNAPSLTLVEALLAQGVNVHLHDPMALAELERHFEGRKGVYFHNDAYSAAQGCDALMLVTEWKEYWSPDWGRLRQALRTPLVLDGRNIFDPGYVAEQGFEYEGVGRGAPV